MKVKTLRHYLNSIQSEGYGSYTLNFSDQDEDFYQISDVCADEDNDAMISIGDYYGQTADELLDALNGFDGRDYVYCEDSDIDYGFDIEGGWYIDDDGDLVMDIVY